MKKEERLNVIKQIILSQKISSQEELLTILLNQGFELTQATLSRDLKHLKVGRIPSESGSTYVISNDFINSTSEPSHSPVEMGFKTIEFSGNMAVIKTLPAYSHAVADALDKADIQEILGTVAGNDTVFLVLRDGVTRNQVVSSILYELPELKSKINLI
jgi:transcriptional regulator of arginine metabolism